MSAPIATVVDPVTTILHGALLEIYYLLHGPNVPPIQAFEQVMSKATPQERRNIVSRAKLLVEYGSAVAELAGKKSWATTVR